MTAENALSRDRICALNDAFRRSFGGGTVVVTAGFESLSGDRRPTILARIRAFDQFNEDNDPHGEHDFGGMVVDGETVLFKIDYYDLTLTAGSEDPANTAITRRVMTVMLAADY